MAKRTLCKVSTGPLPVEHPEGADRLLKRAEAAR
jgi:hypothetical protein